MIVSLHGRAGGRSSSQSKLLVDDDALRDRVGVVLVVGVEVGVLAVRGRTASTFAAP